MVVYGSFSKIGAQGKTFYKNCKPGNIKIIKLKSHILDLKFL